MLEESDDINVMSGDGGVAFDENGSSCSYTKEGSLEIVRQFNQVYEDQLSLIDSMETDNRMERKYSIYREWVHELIKQNRDLIIIVSELEDEANERVRLLESKLQQDTQLYGNRKVLSRLQNDINNLLEVIRRAREERRWSAADLTFQTIKQSDIFGTPDESNQTEDFSAMSSPKSLRGVSINLQLAEKDNQLALKPINKTNISMPHDNGKLMMDCKGLTEEAYQGPTSRLICEVIRDKLDGDVMLDNESLRNENEILKMKLEELQNNNKSLEKAAVDTRVLVLEVAEKHDTMVKLRSEIVSMEERLRQADMQINYKDNVIKGLRSERNKLAKFPLQQGSLPSNFDEAAYLVPEECPPTKYLDCIDCKVESKLERELKNQEMLMKEELETLDRPDIMPAVNEKLEKMVENVRTLLKTEDETVSQLRNEVDNLVSIKNSYLIEQESLRMLNESHRKTINELKTQVSRENENSNFFISGLAQLVELDKSTIDKSDKLRVQDLIISRLQERHSDNAKLAKENSVLKQIKDECEAKRQLVEDKSVQFEDAVDEKDIVTPLLPVFQRVLGENAITGDSLDCIRCGNGDEIKNLVTRLNNELDSKADELKLKDDRLADLEISLSALQQENKLGVEKELESIDIKQDSVKDIENEPSDYKDAESQSCEFVETALVDTALHETALVETALVETALVDTALVETELVDTELHDTTLLDSSLLQTSLPLKASAEKSLDESLHELKISLTKQQEQYTQLEAVKAQLDIECQNQLQTITNLRMALEDSKRGGVGSAVSQQNAQGGSGWSSWWRNVHDV